MKGTWRDPLFRYIPASSHDNASAFRKRMEARKRQAQAVAVEAAAKVAPIKRKA